MARGRRGRAFGLLAGGLALLAAALPGEAVADNGPACGESPSDWCAAPPGDPCGQHHDVASCRADPLCVGMPYRGESVVACLPGDRGFSPNCPTVGCESAIAQPGTAPKPQ